MCVKLCGCEGGMVWIVVVVRLRGWVVTVRMGGCEGGRLLSAM